MRYICLIVVLLLAVKQVKADGADWLVYPSVYEESLCGTKGVVQFANVYEAYITPQNSGEYEYCSNGETIWRLGITSELAVSMNVIMENVELLPNEKLSIYSPAADDVCQIVTMLNMRTDGILQSDIIDGDSLVVEFRGRREPEFVITTVNCGFRPLRNETIEPKQGNKVGYGQSSSCHVDASCDEQYKDINQSTCMLVINGSAYGSGVFVNNTSNDGTPYIITAAHVLTSAGKVLKSCSVYLNYYTPLCTESYQNLDGEVLGSDVDVVLMSEVHDLALLKMKNSPSDEARVYWSGWDINSSHEGKVHCIHYPNGDARKASVGGSVKKASYTIDVTNSNESFVKDNHWLVGQWLSGSTEAGSSGSGLFNKELYLIGSLSGGSATCKSPYNDYYWRLESSWNVDCNGKTLKSVLDPCNTGAKICEGEYHYDTYHYELFFNIETADNIISERPIDGRGYIAGHNNIRTTAIAEQFGHVGAETMVQGVYIVPRRVTTTNDQTFNLKIWADKDGNPDDVLYEYNSLKISSLKKNRQCYIRLSEPIRIVGKFHIGIEYNYNSMLTDTLALYYTTGNVHDGARFKNNGKWECYSDVVGEEGETCNIFMGYKGVDKRIVDTLVEQSISNKVEVRDSRIYITGKGVERIVVTDVMGRELLDQIADTNATMTIVEIPKGYLGLCLVNIYTEEGSKVLKLLNDR